MNPSNPTPYPTGRWTQPPPVPDQPAGDSAPGTVKTAPPQKRRRRAATKLEPGLRKLPLKQLFWGITESQMLEEAAARIENEIRVFLAREALLDCEFQV